MGVAISLYISPLKNILVVLVLSYHLFGLLYKDQNIIWIHPKSQKKIFILRTRLPRKSETRYPFKMTILCMCN